jgi:hypothetical protein
VSVLAVIAAVVLVRLGAAILGTAKHRLELEVAQRLSYAPKRTLVALSCGVSRWMEA